MDIDNGPLARRLSKHHKGGSMVAVVIVVALIAGGLGFASGMVYGKSSTKTANTGINDGFQNGGPGGGGMMRGGTFGAVTAVSTDSITVSDTRSGTAKTYSIASDTTVSNAGATAAVSDIKVGDQVMVRANSSDTSKATRIALGMTDGPGGPGGGGAGQGGTQAQ